MLVVSISTNPQVLHGVLCFTRKSRPKIRSDPPWGLLAQARAVAHSCRNEAGIFSLPRVQELYELLTVESTTDVVGEARVRGDAAVKTESIAERMQRLEESPPVGAPPGTNRQDRDRVEPLSLTSVTATARFHLHAALQTCSMRDVLILLDAVEPTSVAETYGAILRDESRGIVAQSRLEAIANGELTAMTDWRVDWDAHTSRLQSFLLSLLRTHKESKNEYGENESLLCRRVRVRPHQGLPRVSRVVTVL